MKKNPPINEKMIEVMMSSTLNKIFSQVFSNNRSNQKIYNIDRGEIHRGADLFYQIVERLKSKEIDIQVFKKYQDNFFYTSSKIFTK